jgi:DNA adenine methylase
MATPSVLRYAGGKRRAVKSILPYIPDGDVVSPFLGGASLELVLAKTRKVYAGDIMECVINFWTVLQTMPTELIASIQNLVPSKTLYREFQASLNEGTPLERAVKFYFVNRTCFSGCMTGGYSGTRFTPKCIESLRRVSLENIVLYHTDYETLLNAYPTTFAYLDPPYDVPNLYLSDAFNHERLASILHTRDHWLLSYNDTPRIRELYKDCEFLPVKWSYGMSSNKASNEVLIRPKRMKNSLASG